MAIFCGFHIELVDAWILGSNTTGHILGRVDICKGVASIDQIARLPLSLPGLPKSPVPDGGRLSIHCHIGSNIFCHSWHFNIIGRRRSTTSSYSENKNSCNHASVFFQTVFFFFEVRPVLHVIIVNFLHYSLGHGEISCWKASNSLRYRWN